MRYLLDCWLGHVIRMPPNRLPRRLLYGKLLHGQRPVAPPKLRYSDHIKTVLRKCNIPEPDLARLAADRIYDVQHVLSIWRTSQQHLSKQPANVELADIPLPKQLQLGLPVLNVAESVLQISVFAAIFIGIKNRRTDTPRQYIVIVAIDWLTAAAAASTILLLLLLLYKLSRNLSKVLKRQWRHEYVTASNVRKNFLTGKFPQPFDKLVPYFTSYHYASYRHFYIRVFT